MEAPVDPIAARRERLSRLRQRLVTVTLRSRSVRLVKPTRSGALDLHRLIGANGKGFDRLVAALGREGGEPIAIADVATRGQPRAFADDLAALAHAARGAWLETGANDFAIGWPFLQGRLPEGAWIRGPVLLYPASIDVAKTGRARWVVTPLGPPEINESLAHVLSRALGVKLPAAGPGGDDPALRLGCDAPSLERIAAYLEEAGIQVTRGAGAEIEPLAPVTEEDRATWPEGALALGSHLVLGRFPRSESAILADYDQLLAGEPSDEALGVAAKLLSIDEGEALDEAPRVREDFTLEAPPSAIESVRFQVFASDDSQDGALAYAAGLAGATGGLVVQGPPGTGKSQLIANLVAAAIAEGRRVLVVCQKRAALDVVAERLGTAGLREPVAIVHDVQRDRGEVCDAIARTLARLEGAAAGAAADQEREAQDHERDHALATGRVAARLAATREAFDLLAGAPEGRPGLAWLLERALSDDGRPLPDLREASVDATLALATAALPRIESFARQTAPLAAPHPLADRSDWSSRDLAAVFDRVRRLGDRIDALAAAPRGALTPGEAHGREALWAEAAPLLDLFASRDAGEIKAFMLSWAWTSGDAEDGQWRKVTALLTEARRSLPPVPYELVLERKTVLEAHVASLARLEALGAHWYRGFTPEYWRLKKLPREILDRCPSFDGAEVDAASVRRLCEAAIGWQDLILALPGDDVFWDFGLQGAVDDLDHAIERFRLEHARIAAAHAISAALRSAGPAYASLDGIAEALAEHGADVPFFATAVADRRRARLLAEIHAALDALRGDLSAALLDAIAALCAEGDFAAGRARVDALLAVEATASDAARIDRLVAAEPPWVQRFLRLYRPAPGADPGADAILALERAWVKVALGDRTLDAIEQPLVDEAILRRLSDDLDSAQALAGRGALARFRQRVWAMERDPKRAAGLRRLGADAGKKRSRPTLRKLVEKHWASGLSLLRPAWFCSPDAVSALFPRSPDLFDVVVIDEASQCPVEAAVPALARARRAIVAGDDQQMPPSHFFRAAVDDAPDEDDEGPASVLASASILALARVALPGTVLRWHYRSRHEELVAFSNAAFYAGRLITAPRAGGKTSPRVEGLAWDRVEGIWVDETNPVEAARVVDAIGELLAAEGDGGAPPSLGVVAFNRRQAELIEAKIDARAAEDEAFRGLLDRDRARSPVDQLFVRNLENVQGDERDVILLSTGYAPTEPGGRVYARFGPVGVAGGERRLNVAMTRARLGLRVISSIDPAELDVSASKNVGPKLLKAYLSFVHAHARADGAEVARLLALAAALGGARGVTAADDAGPRRERLGDRVRAELGARLRAKGLRTEAGVGLGRRRIDLAVGLPGDQGFHIGVDTTQFLRDHDALSRDVYTPRFWRRLGWRIVRVTPGMWLTRADEVVAQIEALAGDGTRLPPSTRP